MSNGRYDYLYYFLTKLNKLFLKIIKKITFNFFPHIFWKNFSRSQNNDQESVYLEKLANEINANNSFVEFGFGSFEFNSISLAKLGFKGLLLDAGKSNCQLANQIFSKLGLDIFVIKHWVSLSNLEPIIDFVSNLEKPLGFLNIDIDGNDYWILKKLINKFEPHVICVEYNSSLGLKPISTPYKDNFDRHTEHESGWYHGASITAFYNLLRTNYCLVQNIAGMNLIFVHKNKMNKKLISLKPEECYEEGKLRNKWSGISANQQWQKIKHLNFVKV